MAAAPAADDDEYVQLQINEAFIYKCAPRGSSAGHKASEWTEQVAVVRVVVATRGRDVLIRLYRAAGEGEGKLFAVCPIRRGGPPGIEPVTDSSRYFCLRLENDKGQSAFVGLGFNKREDAFDLKSSIADAQKQAEAEERGGVSAADLGISALGDDFSLKQGQSLSIKIGGGGGGAGGAGGGAAAAKPRPAAAAGAGAVRLRAPVAAADAAGGGGGLSPAPPSAAKAPAAPAAPATEAWETF